jgi:ribonucleoside-diphosphate reductase alpha chain
MLTQETDNTPLVADDVYKVIQDNAEFLDSHIIYNRDFNYDYFGFQNILISIEDKR